MRPSRRTAVAILTALVFVITSVGPAVAAEPEGPPRLGDDTLARDSWIVTMAPGADAADAPGLARAVGGQVGLVYEHALHGFQFRGSARAAAALGRNPNVVSVHPDGALYLTETLPWGVARVDAYGQGGEPGAYQAGFRGGGARIAILDSGIDLDHPDLVASLDTHLGIHCVNSAFQPNDGIGHGTHVAGTAAAPVNGVGVVGVAPEARLVPVKMFNDQGQSSEAIAICALDHIIGLNQDADPSNDVDVANMSWGEARAPGDCVADALHAAICRAHDAGIILVAGAGNNGSSAPFVPASYPEVLSISAIADFDGKPGGLAGCGFVTELLANECDDTFAFFSNWGSVDLAAPGVRVHSTWVGGGWRTSSGTSMSTPHVSGVAALMAAAAPGLSPADARAALLATGECPDGTAADSDATAGCGGQGTWPDDPDGTPEPLVNALRAAEAVATTEPTEPEPPSAPTLSAGATPTSIDLSWTAPSSNGGEPVTAYEIYRGASAGTATLYDTVGNVLAWSDTAVVTGQTWFYQVAAVNAVDVGARSNEVSATVPEPPPPADPPSAPTLSAASGNASVKLTWTAPVDDGGGPITNYQVYRGTSAGSATMVATLGNVLTYTDTGRTNGTTYWYQVAAVNSGGVGERSNEVNVTPTAPATRPGPPTGLKAQKVFGGVRLTWSPPANTGGSALSVYKLYRTGGSGGTVIVTLPATELTYLDTTGARRTWYAYVVSASNAVGESQASNIVTIKTQ